MNSLDILITSFAIFAAAVVLALWAAHRERTNDGGASEKRWSEALGKALRAEQERRR